MLKVKKQNLKSKDDKFLKKAIEFHGHLGPYLILGILAGELALERLKAAKYFGITVAAWGVNQKPKSCFIDGLQLSTGATYGKGNITKKEGNRIKVSFKNTKNAAKLDLSLREGLLNKLDNLKGHKDSETFAHELINANPLSLFVFDLNIIH